jgi:hypothetical protein
MTLEEQIGQVLMVGFSSTPPPHAFHCYDRYGPSLFFWQVSFLRLLAATIWTKFRYLKCSITFLTKTWYIS